MPNRSKIKGSNEERAVVNLHKDWGFEVKRTLENGKRSDGSETWDIDLYARGKDKAPFVGECKIKADGFKTIYDMLGLNDFLTLRADKKDRLYVIPERVWAELTSNTKRMNEVP